MSKVVEKKRKYGREIGMDHVILGINSRARYYYLSSRLNRETGATEWLVRVSVTCGSPGMHIGTRGSRKDAIEMAERHQWQIEWDAWHR